MTRAFGHVLRKARKVAGLTMGDLADKLGVTVAYVSSVERGVKAPFTEDKIRIAAPLIGISADELMAAAAQSRGAFVLNAEHRSPAAQAAGAALMRGWAGLSDKQLSTIQRIAEKGVRNK